MNMTHKNDEIPLDAKLLSYAIIELNISRRNVAIYPRHHPSVETTLTNAFKFLKQLFGMRSEITLAIAKDTIIIDTYYLDKKNPVYRDFALNLSKMNIAYITFKAGITKDELYRFHSFISEKIEDLTINNLKEALHKHKLTHIDIGFVDYRKFSTVDPKSIQQGNKVPLWEQYVYGLLEGTLQSEAISDEVRDIPPEILAKMLNNASARDLKEESYDKVITAYIRGSAESIFSGKDLKRLLEFIDRLNPDLKKKFLSSTARIFSEDNDSVYKSFRNISVEEIEKFLDTLNKQTIAMPQPLMNLINKLSHSISDSSDAIYLDEDQMEDEEFLPSNLAELFNNDNTSKNTEISVTGKDLEEIQNLLNFDAAPLRTSHLMEFETEFYDDLIEKRFNQIILEIMSSETVSEEEYQSFVNIIKGQTEQLLWIGQYGQILDSLKVIELNKALHKFIDINSRALQYYHSSEFIAPLIDSFRILGRNKRKVVSMICEYYDKKIIPYLIDALTEETSQIIRRFLMELIKQFGSKVIPEATKRLNDERWFVQRNMLYILSEIDSKEVAAYIRPFCKNANLKVRVAAIKCLLNAGDNYAIEIIREHLNSDQDNFEQAIALSGSFRIKEVVGDLILLLNRNDRTGADLMNKIPVVKALGDIGDTRALDTFRMIISSNSILFRKILEQLKEEIYKTLNRFSYESVKDLVEAGLKSRNAFIREESLRLHKGKAE
jgi:hypothetical protein